MVKCAQLDTATEVENWKVCISMDKLFSSVFHVEIFIKIHVDRIDKSLSMSMPICAK